MSSRPITLQTMKFPAGGSHVQGLYTGVSGKSRSVKGRTPLQCPHRRGEPYFSIVELTGMSDDITSLYQELRGLKCVLQFVRSGRIAVSTSCFERVNEYLAHREERYLQEKK